MDVNFIPILAVPAVPHEGGIRFLHRDDQIDISSKISDSIWKILSFCNGYNNVLSIIKLSDLPKDDILEILSELEELELVVDSRHQFMHFHRISNYPTSISSGLTQEEIEIYTRSERLPVKHGKVFNFEKNKDSAFLSIRSKRRSCRSFSKRTLTVDQIGSICHYAYSIPDHSVPSGGALYPLRIYVLIEKSQDGLDPGYYEYDAELNHLVLFNKEVDIEQLKYCFNQEKIPFGSSVQIVIAADLNRQAYKYANRGYRLTLIEAGHAAENISLYCAEQGLGACEIGGIQDVPLKQELELDINIWPLIAVAVGYSANSETKEFNKIHFVEKRIGEKLPVKNVWVRDFGSDGSFFGATTTYLDAEDNIQYAGATSTSYADAVFKATIEGYERFYSSKAREDFHGSASQISDKWLDPRVYFPLDNEQAKNCGVKSFTKDLDISWVMGIDAYGANILVPSDLVYYGHNNNKNCIYFGNSSGTVAHFDFKEAKKRAVIELIERDALMRSWYAQKPSNILDFEILPIHAIKRIDHWAKQNRRLIVMQIPSSFGMVFETIIIGDEYPCFVSGAAATIDRHKTEDAILKSIQEAEYSLLLSLQHPALTPINPTSVLTPADHGRVYLFKENAKKLRWLYENSDRKNFIEESAKISDLDKFYKQLDLITVDISDPNSDIKIVRVFSRFLVPINFGFNSAHYMHPSLQHSIEVNQGSLKMPHYFA